VEVEQGRFDAAVVDAEHVGSPLGIAYAYARAGRREDALRVTRELEARSRRGEWIYPIQMASIYGALGNADAAFAWLERSYAARDPDLIFIAAEPEYAPIRSDPRFASLARRVGVIR